MSCICGSINGFVLDVFCHAFGFFLSSVPDAVCMSASATACGGFYLFSANCTGLCASTATSSMRSWNGDATGTDQAGYAQAGKEFFHVLTYHQGSSLKDE